MSTIDESQLTDRQRRELEYHRKHARSYQLLLEKPFSWAVLENPWRQWWNAYWRMYAYLVRCDLGGKHVLVVGCGVGEDALRLAKLGAKVSAFDLSAESLGIARKLAQREALEINFEQMPAERLRYPDNHFDCILARDILHHVDIEETMSELVRVSKPNSLIVINEIYSHSFTEKIRRSALVDRVLYNRMRTYIYRTPKPYITEDERKLSEIDIAKILRQLQPPELEEYFNFLVTRIIPDNIDLFAILDRLFLMLFAVFGRFLAGRILISARIAK
jgi:ubiquinone/menaquinone biosynthesis C-methylase UbiE